MELQQIENYKRRFDPTMHSIEAAASCKTQNFSVDDHFRELTKMIERGLEANIKKIETQSKKLPRKNS